MYPYPPGAVLLCDIYAHAPTFAVAGSYDAAIELGMPEAIASRLQDIADCIPVLTADRLMLEAMGVWLWCESCGCRDGSCTHFVSTEPVDVASITQEDDGMYWAMSSDGRWFSGWTPDHLASWVAGYNV